MSTSVRIVGVGALVRRPGGRSVTHVPRGGVVAVDDTVAARLVASGVGVPSSAKPTAGAPAPQGSADPGGLPDTIAGLRALAKERGVKVPASVRTKAALEELLSEGPAEAPQGSADDGTVQESPVGGDVEDEEVSGDE